MINRKNQITINPTFFSIIEVIKEIVEDETNKPVCQLRVGKHGMDMDFKFSKKNYNIQLQEV